MAGTIRAPRGDRVDATCKIPSSGGAQGRLMYAPRPRDGLRVARSSGSDALTNPPPACAWGAADHRWAVAGRARAAAADHPWEEVLAITPVAVRCRFRVGAVHVVRRPSGRRPGARDDVRASRDPP